MKNTHNWEGKNARENTGKEEVPGRGGKEMLSFSKGSYPLSHEPPIHLFC
jgi:hypothetical protein